MIWFIVIVILITIFSMVREYKHNKRIRELVKEEHEQMKIRQQKEHK